VKCNAFSAFNCHSVCFQQRPPGDVAAVSVTSQSVSFQLHRQILETPQKKNNKKILWTQDRPKSHQYDFPACSFYSSFLSYSTQFVIHTVLPNCIMNNLNVTKKIGVIIFKNSFLFKVKIKKNAVFWDEAQCGSCKTDVSEETSPPSSG
jgi:hypothetical protein